MRLRGVPIPRRRYDRTLSKRGTRKVILEMMQDSPVTTCQGADRLQEVLPGISRKSALQRAYMGLRRLAK